MVPGGFEMPTVAREIDALAGDFDCYSDDRGSQHPPAYIEGYNSGHNSALEAADEIAQNADALIEELLELLDEVLLGTAGSLAAWVVQAQLVCNRARHRRAQ